MLDEIDSKTVNEDEDGDQQRKKSKTLSEEKPEKKISKNLQSLLEIRLVQKEVLLSHKLKDHAYE